MNIKYTDYYSKQTHTEEGSLVDSLKEGTWKEFYSSGKLRVIKNYEKGEKHGTFEYFKETGELDFKVTYHYGRIQIPKSKIKKIKSTFN